MSAKHLVEEFSTLEDPRRRGQIEHRLIDILVIAVCAVIAGAESWEDIALYGRSKIAWLSTFLVRGAKGRAGQGVGQRCATSCGR